MRQSIVRGVVGSVVVGVSLLGGPVRAMDANQMYTMYGVGRTSCATLTHGPDNTPEADKLVAWVAGYLTAVNRWQVPTVDVLRGTDPQAALGWLVTYCRAHPADAFAKAVDALMLAQGVPDTAPPVPSGAPVARAPQHQRYTGGN